MQNISKGYLLLFNTLTNMEQSLLEMRDQLISVQQQAEELYMEGQEISEPFEAQKKIS